MLMIMMVTVMVWVVGNNGDSSSGSAGVMIRMVVTMADDLCSVDACNWKG